MTPKFILVTRFGTNHTLMVNPRRMNSFATVRPPTAQPTLNCGTQLDFGRGEFLIVKETPAEIVKMLK